MLGDARARQGANAAPESALVAQCSAMSFPLVWRKLRARAQAAVAEIEAGAGVARNRHSKRAVRFGTPSFVYML